MFRSAKPSDFDPARFMMGSKVPHMREPIEDLHVPPPRVHFAKPPRNYITNPASGGKPKPYESAPQYMELLGVPDALPDEPDPSLRYMPDTSLNPLQKDEVEKARMERSPYLAMLKHKEQDSLLPLARPFSIQQGPIGTLGVSIRDQVRSRRSVALSPSAFGPDGEPLSAREGEEDEVLATLMLDEDGEEDGEAERPASALERARLAPLTPLEMKKLAKMFLIAELRLTQEQERLIAQQFKTECGSLDGVLRHDQFRRCLQVWSVPLHLIAFLFRAFDSDGSHTIDFGEYMASVAVFLRGTFEEKVRFFFDLWDRDRDGVLKATELEDFLFAVSTSHDEQAIRAEMAVVLAKLDLNHDGVISLAELLRGINRVARLNQLFLSVFGDF